MRETTVTLQRPEGTQLVRGIGVQVDQASTREVLEHRAAYDWHGADLFTIITLSWPATLIRRDDVLIDERFIDEETNASYKYRVVSRPKLYDRDHQEMVAEVVPGT